MPLFLAVLSSGACQLGHAVDVHECLAGAVASGEGDVVGVCLLQSIPQMVHALASVVSSSQGEGELSGYGRGDDEFDW